MKRKSAVSMVTAILFVAGGSMTPFAVAAPKDPCAGKPPAEMQQCLREQAALTKIEGQKKKSTADSSKLKQIHGMTKQIK